MWQQVSNFWRYVMPNTTSTAQPSDADINDPAIPPPSPAALYDSPRPVPEEFAVTPPVVVPASKGLFGPKAPLQPGETPVRVTTIRIVRFNPREVSHYVDFKSVCIAWLFAYDVYDVEADLAIMNDPAQLLLRGGGIWLAYVDDNPHAVGAVALKVSPIEEGDSSKLQYEMCKLGVLPRYHMNGIATRLARSAVEYALNIGAKQIIVETNHKMLGALQLYGNLGFQKASGRTHSNTADTVLRLDADKYKTPAHGRKQSVHTIEETKQPN